MKYILDEIFSFNYTENINLPKSRSILKKPSGKTVSIRKCRRKSLGRSMYGPYSKDDLNLEGITKEVFGDYLDHAVRLDDYGDVMLYDHNVLSKQLALGFYVFELLYIDKSMSKNTLENIKLKQYLRAFCIVFFEELVPMAMSFDHNRYKTASWAVPTGSLYRMCEYIRSCRPLKFFASGIVELPPNLSPDENPLDDCNLYANYRKYRQEYLELQAFARTIPIEYSWLWSLEDLLEVFHLMAWRKYFKPSIQKRLRSPEQCRIDTEQRLAEARLAESYVSKAGLITLKQKFYNRDNKPSQNN